MTGVMTGTGAGAMTEFIWDPFLREQLFLLLRLVVAALCGALIGYERESNLKLAGIRTHSIVAVAASLITIISKYGFNDVIGDYVSLDPSRIASGIVTAIGFLGAGVIFTRKMSVSGLTTSAGLWATVGIGMAIGAGMYVPGIACTALILLLQFIFQRSSHILKSPTVEKIVLQVKEGRDVMKLARQAFSPYQVKIINMNISRVRDNRFEVKLYVTFPEAGDVERILAVMREIPEIVSIDVSLD